MSGMPATPQSDRIKLVWMRLYPSDWIRLTAGLSLTAQGALFKLTLIQWDRGVLPRHQAALKRLAGAEAAEWRRAWPEIEPLLESWDDGLIIPQIERERAEAEVRHARYVHGAGKTNAKRWAKQSPGDSLSESDNASLSDRKSGSGSELTIESKSPESTGESRLASVLAIEEWQFTPELAEMILAECPDGDAPSIFQGFKQWARGKCITNRNAALSTYARKHRPSEAERATGKAAMNASASAVMERLGVKPLSTA
jgi:uncharacterized protein YdaU (DUF1376 family)